MAPLSSTSTETSVVYENDEQQKHLVSLIDEATRLVTEEEEWVSDDENDESSEGASCSSSQQRTVSFSMVIKRHEIPALDTYTERELKKCWYSPEDKEKMSRSKDRVVARMERGKAVKGEMTYRGLECWTQKGGKDLDDCIARVVDAVMDEQDRQWAGNCDDWDLIASISQQATVGSAARALEVAKEDTEEAKLAWEQLAQLDITISSHSCADEDIPQPSCRTFTMENLQRRSVKGKRRPSSSQDLTESIKKDRKSKSKKSKSRRSTVDPPAPVVRSKSNDATALMKMRVTSVKA
eukprot:Nitzschia sp. Nitz4//scaffold69_size99277//53799//54683//NITZ4_004633-RA/size99277-processed-gene-0.21-mRNA-1//1//CDS//3329556715//752//frame0